MSLEEKINSTRRDFFIVLYYLSCFIPSFCVLCIFVVSCIPVYLFLSHLSDKPNANWGKFEVRNKKYLIIAVLQMSGPLQLT